MPRCAVTGTADDLLITLPTGPSCTSTSTTDRRTPANSTSTNQPRHDMCRCAADGDGLRQAVAADDLLDDDVAEHLVGALADDHQRGVAVVALDVELRRVAVAAVDADGVERHLRGHLRAEQLGHAGLHVGPPAGVDAVGG